MMRARSGLQLAIALLVTLSMLVPSMVTGTAQQATPGTNTATVGVDLATVPIPPADLPERGYQLSQAGYLEFAGVSYYWSTEQTDPGDWDTMAGHFEQAYSTVYVLLSDRGDPWSEPLATVTTIVIGLDSPEAADEALDTLVGILDRDDPQLVDGATVFADNEGILALQASGAYLTTVAYAFPEQQFSTRQDTEDWTTESVAGLVAITGDRLGDAVALAGSGESATGVATVKFTGPRAGWSIPWTNYPVTQHYRVRDGEAVAYAGELRADARAAELPGLNDLFVSRQQVGDEGYDQVIDISIARFDSEDAAETFALDPVGVTFPSTWQFDTTYANPSSLSDTVRIERATVRGDTLRASGYRTVRRDGSTVQVVQWLGSGNATVTEDALAWLTSEQSDCLDALPEPCAPIDEAQIPLPLSADDVPDNATPAGTLGDGSILASPQFGWQVALPDGDGWNITGAELLGNSEMFQLQSGRSLMTVESVVDQHGDPQQCVLDNLALLEAFEERAVIELGSDDPEERPAGLERNHGWAIYTVEPLQEERADQEYTIRYDCYTLVEGQSSLVVTHTAPRDLWTEERDKGERFRDGITLPSSSADMAITPLAGDKRSSGRTMTMGIPRIWIPLAA